MKFLQRRRAEIIFFAALLAFYLFFSAPGLTWGDGVHIALDVMGGNTPPGYETGHPVYKGLARIFCALYPGGDVARKLNIFSALAAAFAAWIFFRLLLRIGIARNAAFAATAALVFSHLFWFHAEVAEVYSLFACFFFGTVLLLVKYLQTRDGRDLRLLIIVAGLALGAHPFIILSYPAIVFLIIRNRPEKGGWKCAAAALAGFAPVLYVFIAGLVFAGFRQGIYNVLFIGHRALAGEVFRLEFLSRPAILGRNLLLFADTLLYQFPGPAILFVVLGFPAIYRRHRALFIFLVSTAVLDFVFAIDYNVPDQPVFYAPLFFSCAIAGGFGIESVMQWFRRRRAAAAVIAVLVIVFPAVLYPLAPGIYRASGLELARFHAKPNRNPVRYFLIPWKRSYTGIDNYVREVFSTLPCGARVYLDKPEHLFLQYYQRAHNMRWDVRVGHLSIAGGITQSDAAALKPVLLYGQVFVSERYATALARYYRFERAGLLWRARGINGEDR